MRQAQKRYCCREPGVLLGEIDVGSALMKGSERTKKSILPDVRAVWTEGSDIIVQLTLASTSNAAPQLWSWSFKRVAPGVVDSCRSVLPWEVGMF